MGQKVAPPAFPAMSFSRDDKCSSRSHEAGLFTCPLTFAFPFWLPTGTRALLPAISPPPPSRQAECPPSIPIHRRLHFNYDRGRERDRTAPPSDRDWRISPHPPLQLVGLFMTPSWRLDRLPMCRSEVEQGPSCEVGVRAFLAIATGWRCLCVFAAFAQIARSRPGRSFHPQKVSHDCVGSIQTAPEHRV